MNALPATYREFLAAKVALARPTGFEVADAEINPILKGHQRAMVRWGCRMARGAFFATFGLGKSVIQLETLNQILKRFGGRGLIVAPLGVRQEFMRDAAMLGLSLTFIRSIDDAPTEGLCITNYETVRDGKIDPRDFTATSLDEASCLRGFGGTKTFREFMRLFNGVRFKFVATATPSPNEYIELLAYSAFLEVMDVGQAKTRFFKRNSEKADTLTIHPHKEREFWLWVSSWGLFVEKPSDLGCSDEGYDLPPLNLRWHKVAADHANAGEEKDGQGRLLRNAAASLPDAAREKRDSLAARVETLVEIVGGTGDQQTVLWCDLNDEQTAIERALAAAGDSVASLRGSQDIDEREKLMETWRAGHVDHFLSKPMMYGAGINMQQAHTMVFAGIGFKFQDIIQAVHRCHRFLQAHPVDVHLIYTEAEEPIRASLEAKWARHDEQRRVMTGIIREYGLSRSAMASELTRGMGVERVEVTGEGYRLVNSDCVEETRRMAADSVDLIVTSIPFSTQYEYSPNYADFGHTDDDEHFWQQMDFLIPELLRVTAPGRDAVIHVKDRIVPGGINGLGFQTVSPFSDQCIARFRQHGWAFLSRKTVTTDVVRENNQTYRLGWTEQCKDGSRMGNGMPEYVLLFRKPPTDRSNGYADRPVKKAKREWQGTAWSGGGYSRARWQLDAHGYTRSNGNRLLAPEELLKLDANVIFKLWRDFSLHTVYDFEHHVKVAEVLEEHGALPSTFMLLPPHGEHPDVWTDITRMLSMNTLQAAAGREMHLCPLQWDIIDRAIAQYSEPGETIFDPFAGVGSVPFRALKMDRKGVGIELNPSYFHDAAFYCRQAAEEKATPSLFDVIEAERIEEAA